MAAVTVNRRRTNVAGSRKVKEFDVTIAATGDTLDSRLRKIETVKFTNAQGPFTVTGTLVAGTIAITDARITTSCRSVVSRVSNAGTDGHLECVLTASTATVNSSSGADTSIVEVIVFPPSVTGFTKSGGTVTFITSPPGSVANALVEVTGI